MVGGTEGSIGSVDGIGLDLRPIISAADVLFNGAGCYRDVNKHVIQDRL